MVAFTEVAAAGKSYPAFHALVNSRLLSPKVLQLYEFAITFEHEIKIIWTKKATISSTMLLSIRIAMFLSALVTFLSLGEVHVSHNESGRINFTDPNVPGVRIVNYIIAQSASQSADGDVLLSRRASCSLSFRVYRSAVRIFPYPYSIFSLSHSVRCATCICPFRPKSHLDPRCRRGARSCPCWCEPGANISLHANV